MLAPAAVDNSCALWIKIHDFEENIAFGSTKDFENSLTNSFDSLRKLVSWAQRSEALNSEIMIVPMLISQQCQYALGVVIWKSKEILIINSCSEVSDDTDIHFEALLRMAYAAQVVAESPIDHNEWTFLLEENMEAQTNAMSSGVLCVLNAFTICSKQPFWRSCREVTITSMRKWIAKCLANAPNEKIALRDGHLIRRLTPFQRTKMADYLKCCTIPPICITKGSFFNKIKTAIGYKNYVNGKCDFENCNAGTETDSENVIMCCFCRKFFHVGLCVDRGPTSIVFYYCQNCEPRHAENVRLLADNWY